MQLRQSNYFVRLQKVSTFFAGRTISTPPSGLADQLTALNTAITEAQNAAKIQIDATNYLARQTKTVRQLRQTLHDEQLMPLYHSAVALKQAVPGIMDHFTIPRITLRETDYVPVLNSIVDRATEFQAQFIAHGAPADFVTTLSAAITTYATTVTTRMQTQQNRSEARKTLVVSLSQGSAAVQHLNAMVHRIYANDPATMAAWTQAVHVERSASSTKSVSASPATGSTATAGSGTVTNTPVASAAPVTGSSSSAASPAPATTAESPIARAA